MRAGNGLFFAEEIGFINWDSLKMEMGLIFEQDNH